VKKKEKKERVKALNRMLKNKKKMQILKIFNSIEHYQRLGSADP